MGLYAFWYYKSSEVFLSDKFSEFLKVKDVAIPAVDFVKSMRSLFGDLFESAVGQIKLEAVASNASEYHQESEYELKLSFYGACELYILVLVKKINCPGEVSDSSSTSLNCLLDFLPIYVWERDENLKIKYCNKNYLITLDKTLPQAIKEDTSLFSKTYGSAPLETVAMTTKRSQSTKVRIAPNGEERVLEVVEVPQTARHTAFGYAIDITALENLESEYKSYKSRIYDIFNQVSVPIAIFNKDTKLLFSNEVLRDTFRVPNSLLDQDTTVYEIVDFLYNEKIVMEVEPRNDVKRKICNIFEKKTFTYNGIIHMYGGKTMNVVVSSHSNGEVLFFFEDITTKLYIERSYKALSIAQKEIIGNLDEVVLVFGADYKISSFSDSAAVMFGKNVDTYSGTELEGVSIKDFFNQSAVLFKSDESLRELVLKLTAACAERVRANGTVFLSNSKVLNYEYIPLSNGVNFLKFVDITARVNLAKAIRDRSEIVAKVDRIRSRLISNISYDFQCASEIISTYTSILNRQYFGPLNERQKRYCGAILGAGEKLGRLVEAMTELAKIETGLMKVAFSEVNLVSFVKSIVSSLDCQCHNRKIRIIIDNDSKDVRAYIDKNTMRKAIHHMLAGGMDFIISEGKMRIKVSRDVSEDNVAVIGIMYNGIGIRNEHLTNISKDLADQPRSMDFDYFPDFSLLLAQSILKLHGGSVNVEHIDEKDTLCRVNISLRFRVKPIVE